ncbi:MAG: LytR C-terminal domain-containing protein [Gemmatimonadota bacterium]
MLLALVLAGIAAFAVRTGGGGAADLEPRTLPVPDVRVRVEVLNGGGVSGAARSATDLARGAGFDVVYFGNASSFDRVESEVVDRVGRPEFAAAVAEVLGIDNVRSDPDPDLYVDVSVVLGSGWPLPTEPEADRPEP